MEKRKLLNEKLIKVFQHFRKEEIANDVVSLLPDVSWDKIKLGLKHFRLKFCSKTIGKLVTYFLKNENYEDVRHVLNRICLLDVILHKSKIWIPCLLQEPITQVRIQTVEQMERLVLQGIRIEKMNGDIYATSKNDFIYVMIILKKLTKKRGVALTAPLYFAMSLKDPYVFINKKEIPDEMLLVIVKALGFKNYRKHSDLFGRDIQSLMQLLKNKASGMKEPEEMAFVPEVYRGSRSDFYTDNNERLRHAVHYLGENSVQLEELTITGPKSFSGVHESCIGDEFLTSMKIQTKDVCDFIKHLAWKGAMKPPFPMYVKKLNIIGKNKIKLKSDN